MITELVAFALVGLAVGGGAAWRLPELFPVPPTLTVATGLVSALLLGSVAHAVAGPGHLVFATLVAAVSSGLLVSVLARPSTKGTHRRHVRLIRTPGR